MAWTVLRRLNSWQLDFEVVMDKYLVNSAVVLQNNGLGYGEGSGKLGRAVRGSAVEDDRSI